MSIANPTLNVGRLRVEHQVGAPFRPPSRAGRGRFFLDALANALAGREADETPIVIDKYAPSTGLVMRRS